MSTQPSLWDVETGRELKAFDGHSGTILAVALSADNKFLVTGGEDETAKLWEVATGRELRTFSGHLQAIEEVMLSGDGRYLVTGSADGTVKVWDIPTGKERRSFSGRGGYQYAVALSADGKYLVTCVGYTAKLWDVETGRELQTFGGDDYPVTSVALSADSKYLITGNSDSTTCVWSLQDGKLLCRVISFNEQDWAVVDPDGRYDASNGGEVNGLYWVVGNESISLNQLKDRFYEPGLLAKVLGINKEPLRNIAAFKEVKLFPAIDYNVPRVGNTNLNIRLTSRGGGIGKVRVLVNGKEVITDSRIIKLIREGNIRNLTVDLANAPVVVGKPNLIEVIAWNAEGYLSSRPIKREWVPAGDTPIKAPELYAIVTGISNYAASELILHYAAKDAEDIAKALEVGAKRLFGTEKVHLKLLTTSNNPQASMPTKSNIRRAFFEARKAKPWDVLVVYFAGHAGTTSAPHELYCYLTSESSSSNIEDPVIREQSAITSDELTEWIKQIPALKQVLILDTCQAGALATKFTEKRDIPSDQIRAIERLKDRTGFHILMGSAADAVSYEATRYGQGLLTYALLQGMKGAALRDDEYADVSKLFQYAADQVPQLARNIGGVQKPVIAAPRGTSFDIGLFLKEDKEAIPLAMVMPIVLRPLLLNPEQGFDNLGLLPLVRKELQEDSYANTREGLRRAQIVFVDVEELPGAIRPSGIYTVEGEIVKAKLFLIQDGRPIAKFSIEGSKRNPLQLAHAIVDAFGEAIKQSWQISNKRQ